MTWAPLKRASALEGLLRQVRVYGRRGRPPPRTCTPSRAIALLHASPIVPPDPVPDLLLVADLADADRPRETARALELLNALLAASGVPEHDS